MTSLEQWVPWAGGFFEGEGCISLHTTGTLRLTISQKLRQPLDQFALVVGRGGVYTQALNYQYSLLGEQGLDVLRILRPWLIGKAEQADIVIRYYQKGNGKNREWMKQALRASKSGLDVPPLP